MRVSILSQYPRNANSETLVSSFKLRNQLALISMLDLRVEVGQRRKGTHKDSEHTCRPVSGMSADDISTNLFFIFAVSSVAIPQAYGVLESNKSVVTSPLVG
jgi:hypothetical protein